MFTRGMCGLDEALALLRAEAAVVA
jgi:hypothetical protein